MQAECRICTTRVEKSALPLASFFGLAKHFVGHLISLELLRSFLVAWLDIRMDLLGFFAPSLLHRRKIRIGFKLEKFERAHFVSTA